MYLFFAAPPVPRKVDTSEVRCDNAFTDDGNVLGDQIPGACNLLGYRLLPRLKNIGSATRYRPGDAAAYPGLEPVLTRADQIGT